MAIADHLVVAVDFSEPSRVALQAAMQVATQGGSKRLTVLHALRPTVLPGARQPKVQQRLTELRDKVRTSALEQMRLMAGDDAGRRFAMDFMVVEGLPARVIPAAARDLGGTLLAVGTHARRGFRRWLKGSVVEAMLPRLHLPTLVLPMGDDGIPPDAELRRLTHATIAIDPHGDSASVAQRAREVLADIVDPKPAVTLVTVVDVDTPPLLQDDSLVSEVHAMINADVRAMLTARQADFAAADFVVDAEIRGGEIDEEVLSVAERRDSQLIVMGTHGGADLLDVGSTAAEVIRESAVSVLVLPIHHELEEG